ncbi:MAG: cobalamin biosynthesis protein CobD [Firmicutes bacterium]|nr:cobalamin biosynthesis protein CobD [Bacillota bacterium]
MLVFDIAAAYLIDFAAGDPNWLPHPVRLIGWLISRLEGLLRSMVDAVTRRYGVEKGRMERIAGGFLALSVLSATFMAVFLILDVARVIHPILFHALNIYFIYSAFAARCLGDEAMKVYRSLVENDLPEARKMVAMLVSRETDKLDEKEVIRAVVETTAENTVDGVISPILFTVLGSFFGIAAPLAYTFKAASTLDSMVGYMNDKYINFGRASAKLDDALNFISARLSGLIIPIAAFLCGKDFVRSFRIMLRDRRKHKSPNCAYPEAAVAGALGIRLGGNSVYFGSIVEKPTIGDAEKHLEVSSITDTVKIMYVSSFITLLVSLGILLVHIL